MEWSSDLIENLRRKRLLSASLHMLHSLAGLKTQKSRTKGSFVEDRRSEAYYASDLGSKRTNDKFKCWKILIPAKILFI